MMHAGDGAGDHGLLRLIYRVRKKRGSAQASIRLNIVNAGFPL